MMKNVFNSDFQEFIGVLNQHKVDYILIGGYAVILYGYARTTGDLDIWVRVDEINYKKLSAAFYAFGLPVFDMTLSKFLLTEEYDVFTFGRPPVSIDIITKIKGLAFETAFTNAQWLSVEDDLQVRVLQLSDLITSKKAAGRFKDLDDIENLQE